MLGQNPPIIRLLQIEALATKQYRKKRKKKYDQVRNVYNAVSEYESRRIQRLLDE